MNVNGPTWELKGRCNYSTDQERWFSDIRRKQQEAKQICAGCPMRVRCLEVALARNEPYGIWGGLTARERSRESTRRLAAGTPAGSSVDTRAS